MSIDIILTAVAGLVTTVGGSIATFLLSRKKYNVGVDHDTIENLQNALKFYEEVVDSNKKILTDVLEKSEKLANTNIQLLIEVQNLKVQVQMLSSIISNELKNVNLDKYGIQVEGDTIERISKKTTKGKKQ